MYLLAVFLPCLISFFVLIFGKYIGKIGVSFLTVNGILMSLLLSIFIFFEIVINNSSLILIIFLKFILNIFNYLIFLFYGFFLYMFGFLGFIMQMRRLKKSTSLIENIFS